MMNSTNKLSVIIPLYNAGDDFRTCMESLITQTWTALEIIIINDGSTDNSVEIAKHYAENYPHVRLLHQANAGASVARNRGIEVATGKYVAFVDADDEVYPTMYETLMTMALEDDLDVAQCNADWCFRETGETWQSIPSDRLRSTGVLTGPDWLRMGLSSRRWTHVVWMGVYRRDVIVKNNIKFIAGLHHQDIVWTTGFAPIFPDTCYHLTHYWPAAADIPVASDNPVHYADAIRYNARTPLQGSLLPLTRLV